MNSLIITAHPNPQGFTHKIAKKYIEGLQINWNNYELINLYTTSLQQSFLKLDEKNQALDDPHRKTFQNQITWADELVFIGPMRRGDLPSIIKNFIEVNFTSGFAFSYEKEGALKHLIGKKSKIYITAAAPHFFYQILWPFYYILWSQIRLWYCGIKVSSLRIWWDFWSKLSEDKKNTMLQKAFNDSQS